MSEVMILPPPRVWEINVHVDEFFSLPIGRVYWRGGEETEFVQDDEQRRLAPDFSTRFLGLIRGAIEQSKAISGDTRLLGFYLDRLFREELTHYTEGKLSGAAVQLPGEKPAINVSAAELARMFFLEGTALAPAPSPVLPAPVVTQPASAPPVSSAEKRFDQIWANQDGGETSPPINGLSRYRQNLFPRELSAENLRAGTEKKELVWASAGGGYKAGGKTPEGQECWIGVSRKGKSFTLVITRNGEIQGDPLRQKNGFFGGRCVLARLYEAIEPEEQGAASKNAATAPTSSQWAPAGQSPKSLTETLSEPTWQMHLTQGNEIERAQYGTYHLVVVDVTGLPKRTVGYSYRVFVLPSEDADPVIAVNHEGRFYGAHVGAKHVNFGSAPAQVSYQEFKVAALAILGELLLGIRAEL